jgi:hypothetical protein
MATMTRYGKQTTFSLVDLMYQTPAAYMYLGKDGEPEVPLRGYQSACPDWLDAMIYGFGVKKYSGIPEPSVEAITLSQALQKREAEKNRTFAQHYSQPVKELEKPKAGAGEIIEAFARHGWTFTLSSGWERTKPGRYLVIWSLNLAGVHVGSGKTFAEGPKGPRDEALRKAAIQAAVAAISHAEYTHFAREMKDRV